MHVRHRRFHGGNDAKIGLPRIAGTDAALQTHLGSAALPGLAGAPADLGGVEVVGGVAMAEVVSPLRKGAELAAIGADVGVVDVAVDDVGDGGANGARAQRVGGGNDG